MTDVKRKYAILIDLQTFAEPDESAEPTPEPDAPKTVTMTQEDLDALISREKGRVKSKYADYDDLKADRDRLKSEEDARKAAAMTEQERLQAAKDEAERKALEATETGNKALEAANQRLIRAEFKAKARELGIRADALDDAFKLADTAGITVNDAGDVDGVDSVITALVAAKPYLAEAPKQPRQIGGGSGGNETKADKTKEQLIADAAEKARRTGRIEDRMSYAALKEELNK